MMMALAGSKHLAGCPGSRRRDPAPARGRRRRQDPVDRSPLLARRAHACPRPPSWAAGPAPARAAAASFWGRPPRRRSSPRRSASRCRTPRCVPSGQPIWRDMARRSARALVALASAGTHARRRAHRCRHPQRHGRPRRVRRIDQPAAPHPGHRLRRRTATAPRSTTGTRSTSRSPGWSASCPTGRSITRPCAPISPAACPKSCSTCGSSTLLDLSVLTVTGEPLERVLAVVGKERPPAAAARTAVRTGRRRSRRRDHEPERAREQGLTSTVTFPRGNLAPDRVGDQEHGDRPERGRRRRRLSQDRAGAGLHARARRDRRDQGTGRAADPARRYPGLDGPRAGGRGHGRDLSDHGRHCGICRSASTSRS